MLFMVLQIVAWGCNEKLLSGIQSKKFEDNCFKRRTFVLGGGSSQDYWGDALAAWLHPRYASAAKELEKLSFQSKSNLASLVYPHQ